MDSNMDYIAQMREIQEEYPDFYNALLPAMVRCTMENGDQHKQHLKEVFTRTCSKYFYVENVKICKSINSSRCQAWVTYALKTKADLPQEPDLKYLVSLLLKHSPLNSFIIAERRMLELPRFITIPYDIFCKCSKKFFDEAA